MTSETALYTARLSRTFLSKTPSQDPQGTKVSLNSKVRHTSPHLTAPLFRAAFATIGHDGHSGIFKNRHWTEAWICLCRASVETERENLETGHHCLGSSLFCIWSILCSIPVSVPTHHTLGFQERFSTQTDLQLEGFLKIIIVFLTVSCYVAKTSLERTHNFSVSGLQVQDHKCLSPHSAWGSC